MRDHPARVLDHLTEISRQRALTHAESTRLEVALRGCSRRGPRTTKPWLRDDDLKLAVLIVQGFRPPQIALRLGRTERAIWRRMYKLGGRSAVVAMGSIALTVRGK